MTSPTTPRPLRHDPAIVLAGCRSLLPRVLDWGNWGTTADKDADDVLTQLHEAATASLDLDGYELTRYLDTHFVWFPDSQLCDILDGLSMCIRDAWRVAVKEWAAANGGAPEPVVGDKVQYTSSSGESLEGYVVMLDEAHAECLISAKPPPAATLGYKPKWDSVGRLTIVPWENVHAAVQADPQPDDPALPPPDTTPGMPAG